jgi:hypothetical protein
MMRINGEQIRIWEESIVPYLKYALPFARDGGKPRKTV